jgi:arylsulfatase
MDYSRWRIEHAFVLVPAQQFVGQFLGTFKEYPPSQRPGSFSLDRVMESLQSGAQGGGR